MQQTLTPARVMRALAPLVWIGPAVVLIGVVVVWPVVVMIQSSFLRISRFGVVQGRTGSTTTPSSSPSPTSTGSWSGACCGWSRW
nr:hypothetical protein GCM10020093_024810 [Planobispora longispora]